MLTCTPGITACEASVIVPRIVPFKVCAESDEGDTHAKTANASSKAPYFSRPGWTIVSSHRRLRRHTPDTARLFRLCCFRGAGKQLHWRLSIKPLRKAKDTNIRHRHPGGASSKAESVQAHSPKHPYQTRAGLSIRRKIEIARAESQNQAVVLTGRQVPLELSIRAVPGAPPKSKCWPESARRNLCAGFRNARFY